jgi:penicillin-binding protein 1C
VRRKALLAAPLAIAALGLWARLGPLPPDLLEGAGATSTEVLDRRGERLYEALSPEGNRSRPQDPRRLPTNLVDATLAAEDARFYSHPGIDPVALVRAVSHDLLGRRLEGGSTLTQQVVKILMKRPRTLEGKWREALYALRLEHALGKREILALYLRLAPYGNELVGVEAASRGYFGCAPDDLTPAQAALLAALPQRPSALDPYRNWAGLLARKDWVLGRMGELGFLSQEEVARAREERLTLLGAGRPLEAPHFVAGVLNASLPAASLVTTLDARLERKVGRILARHRERLRSHGAENVAVAVLRNDTGEFLAWEGSGDFADREHGGAIDGVVTPRQPGSALKPFTYALAFEKGFTPATVLPDVPSHFETSVPGAVYSPRNYDGIFRGPLLARAALAGSENVPAVYTLSQVGVPDLLHFLRELGLSTLDKTADYYGYGLTMGDAEVRLDELVTAYAVLARGGLYLPSRKVRSGEPVKPRRVISERAAYWIADILSDDEARAYTFGRGGSLSFPFPVAVKTGTSQAYHDNWTVGFTREVTVGVWVGNFDRSPLRSSSGVTGAAPIFHEVLLAAEASVLGRLPGPKDPPLLGPTPGLVRTEICALSGMRAGPSCPRRLSEFLPSRGAPGPCTWHAEGKEALQVPATFKGWARETGLLARGPVAQAEPGLKIVAPPKEAVYVRDPTLRDEFQTVALRATAEDGAGPLTWEVDGRALGSVAPGASLDWVLVPGTHAFAVADALGHRATRLIVVK